MMDVRLVLMYENCSPPSPDSIIHLSLCPNEAFPNDFSYNWEIFPKITAICGATFKYDSWDTTERSFSPETMTKSWRDGKYIWCPKCSAMKES
jgi:hypothetical protein